MSNLFDALFEARKAMKMPPMNGVGHAGRNGAREYRYTTLQDVLKCVVPPLTEHGVLLSQGFSDGKLVTSVAKGDETLVLDARVVNMDGTSQEQGSAETYAKRYALCSVFCIAGMEDDDGLSASEGHAKASAKDGGLVDAYKRMGEAIEGWCARHGVTDAQEVQNKKDGVKKRPEWKSQCRSIDYIESIVREFNNE